MVFSCCLTFILSTPYFISYYQHHTSYHTINTILHIILSTPYFISYCQRQTSHHTVNTILHIIPSTPYFISYRQHHTISLLSWELTLVTPVGLPSHDFFLLGFRLLLGVELPLLGPPEKLVPSRVGCVTISHVSSICWDFTVITLLLHVVRSCKGPFKTTFKSFLLTHRPEPYPIACLASPTRSSSHWRFCFSPLSVSSEWELIMALTLTWSPSPSSASGKLQSWLRVFALVALAVSFS